MHIFHSSSNSVGGWHIGETVLNDMVLSCCSSFIGRAGKDRVSIGVHSFRTSSPNSASLANLMAREPAFFSISSLWFCCSSEAKGCSLSCLIADEDKDLIALLSLATGCGDVDGMPSLVGGYESPRPAVIEFEGTWYLVMRSVGSCGGQ